MKTQLNDFIRCFRTDWIKYRKSLALWISIAYPLLVVILVYMFMIGNNQLPANGAGVFARNSLLVGAFFFPFYLVFLITQLAYVEHRAQGWKLMYTQPVGRTVFFVSKLAFMAAMVTLSMVLEFLFSILAVQVLDLFKDQIKINDYIIQYNRYLYVELRMVLSSTAMVAVQFLIAYRSRNFIFPFGAGAALSILPLAVMIILGITGIITTPDKLITFLRFDPYSLPYSFVFDFANMKSNVTIAPVPVPYVYVSMIIGGLILTGTRFFVARSSLK